MAKQRLEAYRQLRGKNAAAAVAELEKEIEKLSLDLQDSGVTNTFRNLWARVTKLFQQEPGQAHETAPPEQPEKPKN